MADSELKNKSDNTLATIFLAILLIELLDYVPFESQKIFEPTNFSDQQVVIVPGISDNSYRRINPPIFVSNFEWPGMPISGYETEQPDFHQEDSSQRFVTSRSIAVVSGTTTSSSGSEIAQFDDDYKFIVRIS